MVKNCRKSRILRQSRDSLDLKQKVIDSNELVKALYETAENPTFEVFTVTGKATIADFSGNPPKTYDL